jgi:hypothetical protein
MVATSIPSSVAEAQGSDFLTPGRNRLPVDFDGLKLVSLSPRK